MSIAFASEDLESRLAVGGLGFARFGEALHREKRTADALRVLGDGTRRHPEYTPGLLILGRLYFETGALLEAKAELEKILKVESRCPAALDLLARIAEGLRAYGESARLYSQLAALEPWDSEFGESHRRALELSGGGTISTSTQESPGFVEVDLNEVGNFLPQEVDAASSFEMGSATVAVEPPRASEPKPEAANIYSPPAEGPTAHADTAVVEKERVEGEDIEKRLDDLFSTETATVETMVPGKSGGPSAPPPMVTGEDIEDQLDKLFSSASDTMHQPREADFPPAKPSRPAPSPDATFFPGMDERTVSMPAFSSLAESLPKAEPFAPPSAPQAPEEIMEAVDMRSVTETGVFETAEVHGTSDQVIGEDIGNRLDELFGSESEPARSASLNDVDDPGTSETLAYLAPTRETTFTEKGSGAAVSGNDIEDRLSEMFDLEPPKTGEPQAPAKSGFHEEAAQTLGFSRADVFNEAPIAEPLDEDSFPEAAPNVATVTLAEIYFDQGLKEQALQIYRQLLEREPGNESVKKRLEEIEASKPAETRGSGSPGEGGPPPPRPGLKVPRRKK